MKILFSVLVFVSTLVAYADGEPCPTEFTKVYNYCFTDAQSADAAPMIDILKDSKGQQFVKQQGRGFVVCKNIYTSGLYDHDAIHYFSVDKYVHVAESIVPGVTSATIYYGDFKYGCQ